MAEKSHPYREDSIHQDSDDDGDDQVVFDVSGKRKEKLVSEQHLSFREPSENADGVLCGLFGFGIHAFDRFATIGAFRVCLGILLCFQGMFYAFWISVLSSLEKQYELSSSQIGFATSMGELGRIVCLIGLSFIGELHHKPRWIALSSLLVVVSYLLLGLPELFTPDSSWKNLYSTEICTPELAVNSTGAPSICPRSWERYSWRVAAMSVFCVSHFLSGVASAVPLAYGIALLFDHFPRKDSAMYLGLHFISKVLGPVFGFLLGALSTAMFFDKPELSSVQRDPRWLDFRSWHVSMGILIISLLNICASIAMMMFPAEFPVELQQELSIHGSISTKGKEVHNVLMLPGYRKTLSTRLIMPFVVVKEDLRKLLPNYVYLTRVFVVVINVFITSGFYVFLPKYLETQFYVQPNAANIATAIAILLPTGCGILTGCFMYRYCIFKPKQSTMLTAGTSVIFFVGFFLLIAFRCDTRKMAGSRTPNGLVSLSSPCNSPCMCEDSVFNPVCDVPMGVNYFSACRAGCERVSHNASYPNLIRNCRCATDSTLESIQKGFCSISCNKFWPFIFMLFLILFISSIPTVGSVMLIYRTVPADLMQIAHIFMAVCVGILALFPSPIVFGGIMDSSCILWSTQGPGCVDRGGCLVHDNDALAFQMMGMIGGMKIIAVLIDLYIFWKSKDLQFEDVEPSIMWSPDAVRVAFVETVGR